MSVNGLKKLFNREIIIEMGAYIDLLEYMKADINQMQQCCEDCKHIILSYIDTHLQKLKDSKNQLIDERIKSGFRSL